MLFSMPPSRTSGISLGWSEPAFPDKGGGTMSDFQIIESLCALAEEQNAIIRAMNLRLGELGVAFGEDELAAADEHYRRLLGRETSRKGGDTSDTD